MRNSLDTAAWVHRQGVKLSPGSAGRPIKVDGKFKFWGGLALHIWGGGPEMLKALYATAEKRGVKILYETPAVALIREHGRVVGVVAEHTGERIEIRAGAVVLACGGYEFQSGDARALSRAGAGSSRRSAARASTWAPG